MQILNQDDKEVRFSFSSKSAKQIIGISQEAVKEDDSKLALACYEGLFNITCNLRDNMVYSVTS